MGVSPSESAVNRRRLEDLGLASVALPCGRGQEETLDRTIEHAHALGAPLIVCYWGPAESEDQLKRDAEVYERMALRCKAAGLRYCYHNHAHEFTTRFGDGGRRYALEVLLEHAPHLQVELDVAWCRVGGVDPVALLARLAGRAPIVHLKDIADPNIRGRFCSLGNGVLDCRAALQAAVTHGASWVVVEQDSPDRLTPMESVTAGILNLKERGLVPRRK